MKMISNRNRFFFSLSRPPESGGGGGGKWKNLTEPNNDLQVPSASDELALTWCLLGRMKKEGEDPPPHPLPRNNSITNAEIATER